MMLYVFARGDWCRSRTMRGWTHDLKYAPRFQAACLALGGFRQNDVPSARASVGMAPNPAHQPRAVSSGVIHCLRQDQDQADEFSDPEKENRIIKVYSTG